MPLAVRVVVSRTDVSAWAGVVVDWIAEVGEMSVVDKTEVDCPGITPDVLDTDDGTSVSVTGQIVVETAIIEVMTVVESAGQLVTVGAQLVMVISVVL